MLKEKKTEKIPIKLWCDEIETGAMQQIENIANLPFAFHHIAIMPDCHSGYGMPIGGVLAAKNAIIPNAVGVDIGCGMCAAKTSLKDISKDELKKILGEIRSRIPLGFEHHKNKQPDSLMPKLSAGSIVCEREWKNALTQVGALGGGNHFIEIQKGNDGHIWLMIHSGSRNLGKQVADYYNRLAKKHSTSFKMKVPPEFDLAYFPVDSEDGRQYLEEMKFCVKFAFNNRKKMAEEIFQIFSEQLAGGVSFEPMINIEHNYAREEKHFGETVWVHRKGATLAENGTIGIIPGSQGARSYIAKGLGNPESYNSCSHGAGRRMSRHEAIKTLSLEEEKKKLESSGVLHSIRSKSDLDEAPSAYKNIEKVMNLQSDLVEVMVVLSPLAVVKG